MKKITILESIRPLYRLGYLRLLLLVIPSLVTTSVYAEAYTDLIRYEYDGLNRLKSASSGAGIAQEFTLDAVANRTTEIRRDSPIGAPRALSNVYGVVENTILNIGAASGVLGNDDIASVNNAIAAQITAPLFGTFNLNEDGSFTYQPNSDYHGVDEFAYQIQSDTFSSNVVRVKITILPENPLPIAEEVLVTLLEDTSLLINVLQDNNNTTVASIDTPFHGTAVIQDNQILYKPTSDYVGQDVFNYVLVNSEGSSSNRVVVTVLPENDPPQLIDIEHLITFGSTATIPVLINAVDPEGEALTISNISDPVNGIAQISDGSIVYTPANFEPTIDSNGDNQLDLMSEILLYEVQDSSNNTSQARVLIFVTDPEQSQPIVIDDCYTLDPVSTINITCTVGNTEFETNYQQSVLLPVLANDFDPQGDILTITSAGTTSSNGTVEIIVDQLLFTPSPDIENQEVLITYTIADSTGQAAEREGRVITLVRRRDNTANRPRAVDDCYSASASSGCTANDDYLIDYGSSVLFDVLANDTDPNDENLRIIFASNANNGAVEIINENQIRYTANQTANILGFQDTFIYRIQNDRGLVSEASVYIRVKPRDNIAPVGNTDSFIIIRDQAKNLNLTANDTDANFDSLSIVANSITQGSRGSVTVISNTTVRYTPDNNAFGEDSFTYRVQDPGGEQSGPVFVRLDIKKLPPLVPIYMLLLFDDESESEELPPVSPTE